MIFGYLFILGLITWAVVLIPIIFKLTVSIMYYTVMLIFWLIILAIIF